MNARKIVSLEKMPLSKFEEKVKAKKVCHKKSICYLSFSVYFCFENELSTNKYLKFENSIKDTKIV